MAVLHRYTHDGTNGATVTTGNSGYAATVGAGTAATYSTASPALGTAHIVFASGNTNAWQLQATDAGAYTSFFVNVSAAPGTTMQIARARTTGGGALIAAIRLDTGRHLAVYDGAGTLKQTSTTVLTTNTWYQVLWNCPGDGTQTLRIYNQAGTSLLETMTPGASSASAGTVADHTIGQNTASVDTWRCDHHRIADAALHAIQAPTAAFSVTPTAGSGSVSPTNTSTANTGDGETLTYDWDWGDGTSHSTTASPTHVYATSNTFTITLTVTDSDGQVATVNHNVTITLYTPFMDTLTYHLNRLALTLSGSNPGVPTLEATGAANVWAGTTGLELVGALNAKAGNARGAYKDLAGVLNQLAGTTGLEPAWAAGNIAS